MTTSHVAHFGSSEYIKFLPPPPKPCFDPEHGLAAHRVYPVGTHTHVCPTCGVSQVFRVTGPIWVHEPKGS